MKFAVKQKLYQIGQDLIAYEAVQTALEKKVELRIVQCNIEQHPQEARAYMEMVKQMAKLDHAYLLRILESGVVNQMPYYLTNYKEGVSLRQLVEEQDTEVKLHEKVKIMQDLAGACKHMHQRGVVHGALDVDSIRYNREVKIAYIAHVGVGCLPVREGDDPGAARALAPLSPEKVQGKEIDARIDQFLLGAAMYHWIAGKEAYPVAEQPVLYASEESSPPQDLREILPACPPSLADLFTRLLAFKPDGRFFDDDMLLGILESTHDETVLTTLSKRSSRRTTMSEEIKNTSGGNATLASSGARTTSSRIGAAAPGPDRGRTVLIVILVLVLLAAVGLVVSMLL